MELFVNKKGIKMQMRSLITTFFGPVYNILKMVVKFDKN